MMNFVVEFYGIVIGSLFKIVSLYKITDNKWNYKDKNFIIVLIIYSLYSFIIHGIDYSFIRILFSIVGLIFLCSYLFGYSTRKLVILSVYFKIILLFSELVCLILILIFVNINPLITINEMIDIIDQNLFYSCLINIISLICIYIISNFKFLSLWFNKLVNFFDYEKSKNIIIIISTIFLLLTCSYLAIINSNDFLIILIVFTLLLIMLFIILIKNVSIKTDYNIVKENYNSTSKNLKEYEEMLDKYRVYNHENKNQLMMIRNMIEHGDTSVTKYIDNLLDTVYIANDVILMQVSKIPSGGLRATIYSKLLIMDDYKIKHNLNIDSYIRYLEYFENNSKITLDICNIMSIFIDNAIDECKNNYNEFKEITISIYEENENIFFEVSNYCNHFVDLERIYEKKYTTKEKGHGYGLSYAKELIDNNSTILKNITLLDNNIFIQKLVLNIKIKK